jgi:hypothetical protein
MNARYVLTYTSNISIASNLHLHIATTSHFFHHVFYAMFIFILVVTKHYIFSIAMLVFA